MPQHDPKQVAEDISNTIASQDDTIILQPIAAPAASESKPASEDKPSSDEPDDEQSATHDDKDKPTEVAGYSAADLLNAPVKPPEPKQTEGREFTDNKKVLLMVAVSILLFVVGIIVAVAGVIWLGIVLAVIAAIGVALGVFLPLH